MPYDSPRCIAIFGNTFKTERSRYTAQIINCLHDFGVEVVIEEMFAHFINTQLHAQIPPCPTFTVGDWPVADVAISIGGDGTFLGTAAYIGSSGIPILGINTGHLGFLADVSPQTINDSITSLCQGNYIVEQRATLQVKLNGHLSPINPYALNEVAILKHDNSSLIEIDTRIDKSLLANYLADGLIIATPTGSTGYALSVGGPILAPNSSTLCIAPVAPHSLSIRPVVVCDDVEIELSIKSRTQSFLLATDGKSRSLPSATVITLKRAPHTIGVIKIVHHHFFDTLRDKLLWGADQRD